MTLCAQVSCNFRSFVTKLTKFNSYILNVVIQGLLTTRSFRLRQDRHLSVPVQVLELRHHRLRRLRRTRQRDVRSPARFPRIDGRRRREDRVHHGPHDPRGQHLQHAGRRSRGLHLHRHHVVRILSRYGLQRFHDGGLHFSLGRSLERNFRQVG